jgi:hypothetical protein
MNTRNAQRNAPKDTRGVCGDAIYAAAAVAGDLMDAAIGTLRNEADRLVYAALIHLAAEPYTDAEIYDPFFDSEDYELAREIQAIESLLTGRLAAIIGVGRMIRLLGGAEPIQGLGLLMAAERKTDLGDLVFLTFEYDSLVEDAEDVEDTEPVEPGLTVAVFRTDAESPWQLTDRVAAADSTFALIEFYSERSPRQKWA